MWFPIVLNVKHNPKLTYKYNRVRICYFFGLGWLTNVNRLLHAESGFLRSQLSAISQWMLYTTLSFIKLFSRSLSLLIGFWSGGPWHNGQSCWLWIFNMIVSSLRNVSPWNTTRFKLGIHYDSIRFSIEHITFPVLKVNSNLPCRPNSA